MNMKISEVIRLISTTLLQAYDSEQTWANRQHIVRWWNEVSFQRGLRRRQGWLRSHGGRLCLRVEKTKRGDGLAVAGSRQN